MTSHTTEACDLIDHATEAVALLNLAAAAQHQGDPRHLIAAAHVHATLAVAEQARIANLVALALYAGEYDENIDLLRMEAVNALVRWVPHDPDDEHPEVRPRIAAALGVE